VQVERAPDLHSSVLARVAIDDARAYRVHATQSGVVRSIQVEAGREVERGATLLALDVDVASARSTALQRATGDVIAAAHNLHRALELRGELTVRDIDERDAEYAGAAAALVALRHRMRTGTSVVQVLASHAGMVVHVEVKPGQPVVGTDVEADFPMDLMQVANIDRVILLSDDAPAGTIPGAAASFRAESVPGHAFSCEVAVAQFAPRLRCSVDNVDHVLKPGMVGTLMVRIDR